MEDKEEEEEEEEGWRQLGSSIIISDSCIRFCVSLNSVFVVRFSEGFRKVFFPGGFWGFDGSL